MKLWNNIDQNQCCIGMTIILFSVFILLWGAYRMSMLRSVYDSLNGFFCNSEGMFGQNLTAGGKRLLTWAVRCRNQLLDMKDIFLCFSVLTEFRAAVILCCQSLWDGHSHRLVNLASWEGNTVLLWINTVPCFVRENPSSRSSAGASLRQLALRCNWDISFDTFITVRYSTEMQLKSMSTAGAFRS